MLPSVSEITPAAAFLRLPERLSKVWQIIDNFQTSHNAPHACVGSAFVLQGPFFCKVGTLQWHHSKKKNTHTHTHKKLKKKYGWRNGWLHDCRNSKRSFQAFAEPSPKGPPAWVQCPHAKHVAGFVEYVHVQAPGESLHLKFNDSQLRALEICL